MTQLVERSLPIPEVRGWNAVISKKNIEHLLYLKDENKGKEGENYPFLIEVATACAKLRLSILLIRLNIGGTLWCLVDVDSGSSAL